MSWFKKTSKDDDGSQKLLADVMNKVLPHLNESVKAHVENEKQKVISSVVNQMQQRLSATDDTHNARATHAYQDPNLHFLSPAVNAASTNQEQMLGHVMQHMLPYIDQSVKKIVDKEKDNLIGNVVGNIQQNIEQKTSV